jgi:hypothetical protein
MEEMEEIEEEVAEIVEDVEEDAVRWLLCVLLLLCGLPTTEVALVSCSVNEWICEVLKVVAPAWSA